MEVLLWGWKTSKKSCWFSRAPKICILRVDPPFLGNLRKAEGNYWVRPGFLLVNPEAIPQKDSCVHKKRNKNCQNSLKERKLLTTPFKWFCRSRWCVSSLQQHHKPWSEGTRWRDDVPVYYILGIFRGTGFRVIILIYASSWTSIFLFHQTPQSSKVGNIVHALHVPHARS